jgi:hypothetical protein
MVEYDGIYNKLLYKREPLNIYNNPLKEDNVFIIKHNVWNYYLKKYSIPYRKYSIILKRYFLINNYFFKDYSAWKR